MNPVKKVFSNNGVCPSFGRLKNNVAYHSEPKLTSEEFILESGCDLREKPSLGYKRPFTI